MSFKVGISKDTVMELTKVLNETCKSFEKNNSIAEDVFKSLEHNLKLNLVCSNVDKLLREMCKPQSMRDLVISLVKRYKKMSGATEKTIWRKVFNTLYCAYGISVNQFEQDEEQDFLDIADYHGFIGKIYDIIDAMIKEHEGIDKKQIRIRSPYLGDDAS